MTKFKSWKKKKKKVDDNVQTTCKSSDHAQNIRSIPLCLKRTVFFIMSYKRLCSIDFIVLCMNDGIDRSGIGCVAKMFWELRSLSRYLFVWFFVLRPSQQQLVMSRRSVNLTTRFP